MWSGASLSLKDKLPILLMADMEKWIHLEPTESWEGQRYQSPMFLYCWNLVFLSFDYDYAVIVSYWNKKVQDLFLIIQDPTVE